MAPCRWGFAAAGAALVGLLVRGVRAQRVCGALAGCPLSEVPQAKLVADDAAAHKHFGKSVAIAAGVAIVGARWDDDAGSNSGSAYLFAEDGSGGWAQVAKLVADDAAASDLFGISVAIAAGVAIGGAYRDDDAGTGSGSAYLFAEDGS